MSSPDQIARAEQLGRKAFETSSATAPCQDPELMSMLKGNRVGEGLDLLKAWNRGWHKANLAAPW